MKYLLDTAVWLWSTDEVDRIGDAGRKIIADGRHEIYLSAVTAWELSIKMRLGKLTFPGPPSTSVPAFMTKQGLRPLTITLTHAVKVYDLPPHHADPFDRLLIAQAIAEDMAILTSDRAFKKYDVELVWCGTGVVRK
ncbi:MAG TPA: type II toxin-antitoxin system VapC family toxin [Candidatus Sulfotelmatobacter sp.]|nr:type II toxin-antitoxin system VapC family toxin [Candidatus Sulfotelmatobacter sp.]